MRARVRNSSETCLHPFTVSGLRDCGGVKTGFRSAKSLTVAKWLLTPKSAILNRQQHRTFPGSSLAHAKRPRTVVPLTYPYGHAVRAPLDSLVTIRLTDEQRQQLAPLVRRQVLDRKGRVFWGKRGPVSGAHVPGHRPSNCNRLRRAGAKVVVSGRREEEGSQTVRLIRQLGAEDPDFPGNKPHVGREPIAKDVVFLDS